MSVSCHYNETFVRELINQVDDKIALITNKDYKNSVYDLGLHADVTKYSDLIEIQRILNKMLTCSECYEGYEIGDIVSMVKNKLQKC